MVSHSVRHLNLDEPLPISSHTQFGYNLRVGSLLVHAAKRSRLKANLLDDETRLNALSSESGNGDPPPALEHPVCRHCNTFRKLAFRDGVKCRELCPCDRRSKRRRLHSKQPDRWGLLDAVQVSSQSVHRKDAKGHLLFVYARAGITWCMTCGAFTGTHIKDLGRQCNGMPGTGKATCLRRLRGGLHPVTGNQLEESAERVLID